MSPKFKLDKYDWSKIGVGALIAVTGAVLTYGTNLVAQWQTDQSLGSWTPIVVTLWSVIANAARKWIKDNKTIYNIKGVRK